MLYSIPQSLQFCEAILFLKLQYLQNGNMLHFSPDRSGNPFWAGVQRKKITSSVRYRSGAADSGTILPYQAL